MTCREFESGMRSQFGSLDREEWKLRITRGSWDGLLLTEHISHLSTCHDCQTSLFQFLDARDFLNYESHPCFHIAYYSAETPDRCLDFDGRLYAIVTDREKRRGVVIGFCPWCSVSLPTGIALHIE